MPVKPSKKLAIAQRRGRVAELYLKSLPQWSIGEKLGVAQATVCTDLRAIRMEWKESRIRDFDEARVVELAKLDRLEREAWDAWERSKQAFEATTVLDDGSGRGKRAQKTIAQKHHGDVRFLEQIHKCIAARRALLGLDAPARVAPVSPDGTESYHAHVMAELMRIAEQSRNGPVVIDGTYIEKALEGEIAAAPRHESNGDVDKGGLSQSASGDYDAPKRLEQEDASES